ncbi:MAG TPA: hypothetical protein VF056_03410 [Thermoleophilaceae bacterium]
MTNRTAQLLAIAALLAALAAVTAALALSSDDEPLNTKAARQRVAIVTQGVQTDPASAAFELTPLQAGVLKRDSGKETSNFTGRATMRHGQRVVVTDGVETLHGDRGVLELRFRIEWVGAGNDYRVGAGTWKIVRGTGRYADLTGGGRRGDIWLKRGRGPWSGRAEGLLTSPP